DARGARPRPDRSPRTATDARTSPPHDERRRRAMSGNRDTGRAVRAGLGALLAAGLAAVAFAGTAGAPSPSPPASPAAYPVVQDTPKNLQVAFTGEMNAKN